MAERTIVGVDFSGAKDYGHKGKTWITKGQFNEKKLVIEKCDSISRQDLEQCLVKLPSGSVAAMDFPFALPCEIAKLWRPSASEMPTLWAAAAEVSELKHFYKKVAAVVDSELLRVGDLCFPNAQPCLHRGRPNMVPMTFRGMQMLHRLWKTGRFRVPPLTGSSELPVLLEVMPGAALRNFNLSFTRYKDGPKEQQQERRSNREKIIKSLLSGSAGVQLQMPDYIVETCIERPDGDGLDSVVAATVAARWTLCETDFCVPSEEVVTTLKRNPKNKRRASIQARGMTKLAAAQLEGWIYAPKK